MSTFGVVVLREWQARLVRKLDPDVPISVVGWTMPLGYPAKLLDVEYDEYLFLGGEAFPPGSGEYASARKQLRRGVDLVVPFRGHGEGSIAYYLGLLFAKRNKSTTKLYRTWGRKDEYPWDAFRSALWECPVKFWPVPASWWKGDLVDGVAVVVPCYDHESYLVESVGSALEGGADQVIVVDDGSPGDVVGALAKFRGRPVYVLKQGNEGLPAARNSGIRAVTVTRVLSLDADDKLDARVLAAMRRATVGNVWVYSDVYLFGDVRKRVPVSVNERSMRAMQPAHPAVMFPKAAWRYVGGYDESIGGFESWDFHARLIQGGYNPVKVEGLVWYRKHEGSMLAGVLRNKEEHLRALRARSPVYFREKG